MRLFFKKGLISLFLLGIILHAAPSRANTLVPVTIANGTSLSTAGSLVPFIPLTTPSSLVGIQMPAAWTSASITLQGSSDNCTTFYNLFVQAGTEYTVTSPAASEYMILSPSDMAGLNCIKVRSGTAGSPVNQGADRILNLVLGAK